MKKQYYGQNPELDAGVERLIDRVILKNQTALVDQMLNSDLVSFDDIENLYPNPEDWDIGKSIEWIQDNQGWDKELDREPEEEADDYQERLHQYIRDNGEPAEIFEWYLIDKNAADWFRNQDQVLLEAYGCVWWGRQTTGQSIQVDSVPYDIYQDEGLNWE